MRGLLYGAPVGLTITADTEFVKTLSISVNELLDTADTPQERDELMVTMRKSMQIYLLRQVPQLKQMADDYFDSVHANTTEVEFKRWDVIFSKGSLLDSVYILERGKIVEHMERRIISERWGMQRCTVPSARRLASTSAPLVSRARMPAHNSRS
jgi:CRP-like cAMP-binding protein